MEGSENSRCGITQVQAKQIVQMLFDGIVNFLAEDGRVKLRNFGVFEVKRRKARTARNPSTGEQVPVPEKHAVTFKTGRLVEERIAEECRAAEDSGLIVPDGEGVKLA
jgi:nucleoid DNA-binding protein